MYVAELALAALTVLVAEETSSATSSSAARGGAVGGGCTWCSLCGCDAHRSAIIGVDLSTVTILRVDEYNVFPVNHSAPLGEGKPGLPSFGIRCSHSNPRLLVAARKFLASSAIRHVRRRGRAAWLALSCSDDVPDRRIAGTDLSGHKNASNENMLSKHLITTVSIKMRQSKWEIK